MHSRNSEFDLIAPCIIFVLFLLSAKILLRAGYSLAEIILIPLICVIVFIFLLIIIAWLCSIPFKRKIIFEGRVNNVIDLSDIVGIPNYYKIEIEDKRGHTRTFFDIFGVEVSEFIPCENVTYRILGWVNIFGRPLDHKRHIYQKC